MDASSMPKESRGAKQFAVKMDTREYRAIERLRKHHGFARKSQAVRYAISQTAAAASRVLDGSEEAAPTGGDARGPTRLRIVYLMPEQDRDIAKIIKGFKRDNKSDAICFAIRMEAAKLAD